MKKKEEAIYSTWAPLYFAKIELDIVYIANRIRKRFLVIARCDLCGWPKARALAKADSKLIAKLI